MQGENDTTSYHAYLPGGITFPSMLGAKCVSKVKAATTSHGP